NTNAPFGHLQQDTVTIRTVLVGIKLLTTLPHRLQPLWMNRRWRHPPCTDPFWTWQQWKTCTLSSPIDWTGP
ncbi:hypothetical protein NDU88_000323, partial [Pleurodeles waltl]